MTAHVDQRAISYIIEAERLYIPTRTIPETAARTRRLYSPAFPGDTAAVTTGYAAAARATGQLLAALDKAAITIKAPSQTLALARRATASPRGTTPRAAAPAPRDARPPLQPIGSLEALVQQLGVHEPMLLLRARAVDNAAQQILTEAWDQDLPIPASTTARGLKNHRHSDNLATAIASRSFPRGARALPSGSGAAAIDRAPDAEPGVVQGSRQADQAASREAARPTARRSAR